MVVLLSFLISFFYQVPSLLYTYWNLITVHILIYSLNYLHFKAQLLSPWPNSSNSILDIHLPVAVTKAMHIKLLFSNYLFRFTSDSRNTMEEFFPYMREAIYTVCYVSKGLTPQRDAQAVTCCLSSQFKWQAHVTVSDKLVEQLFCHRPSDVQMDKL